MSGNVLAVDEQGNRLADIDLGRPFHIVTETPLLQFAPGGAIRETLPEVVRGVGVRRLLQ